ncbi:Rap1 GTPase-GDP dissociation stimulator 1 [Coemansia biformis]|uniref:Rap1 GTPase-GDP dissociation stimulator 1 n=1 Tax=Coemansia biformis TaxID=1286918 RepID=A0A9W7Y7Y5_9FUNG|nr:Rap1 GTPase-GDP dissociation stimulator 1 [Coemansia biformis]
MLLLFAILEHFLDNNSGNIESEANDSDGEKQADDEQAGEPDVAAAPQPPNRPMPQSANRQADAVTQMIVGISGEDDALEVMYANSDLMQRLLGILEAEDGGTPQRDALAAAAALCLGNLARTDAHCVQLVGEHPSLVRRLIHGWFARREAGVHVRHAVSGLLKNLCLPAANKQHLADMGLPVVAAANIDTAVVPIQANAIGILRHLATGAPAAATVAQMMQPLATTAAGGECAMQALLRIVKGTDIDGIRCEGTRLVAGVAKKIYLRRGASAAAESALLDKAQQTMEDKALDIVTPLIRLVLLDGQRHPLLQQESLVTLTVLAASQTVALKTTAYGGAPSYAHAIIAMLDPARSAPLAIPPAAAEDGSEESNESDRRGFGDALHALLRQEDAVWPQSTLQAKSLVNQLLATADDCADTAGLEVLHTKLAPLAT